MTVVIHKQGKEKFEYYVGFGHYASGYAPLCAGAKSVYKGNKYLITRLWKNVTCKHCLKRRK